MLRYAHAGVLVRTTLLSLAFGASPCRAEEAPKIDPNAEKVLRAMSDFYAGAAKFHVGMSATLSVEPRKDKEKTTVVTSLAFERPNRVAARVAQGDSGLSVLCDGKQLVIYEPIGNSWLTEEAPPNLDALLAGPLEFLTLGQGLAFAAPLVSTKPYDVLMEDTTRVDYRGQDELNGVKAHHLSFTQNAIDFEMWIDAGHEPRVLRIAPNLARLVASNNMRLPEGTTLELAIDFKDWNFEPKLEPETFTFKPPEDAKKVASIVGLLERLSGRPRHELEGKPAPNIELKLLDGGATSLADHKGKEVVVLEFWATWCGPCVQGLPSYAEIAAAYRRKGVALYTVNLGEEPEAIREFLKQQNLDLPVALDPDGSIAMAYGVEAIPQTVIIGKDGVIASIHVGLASHIKETVGPEIDALLGQ